MINEIAMRHAQKRRDRLKNVISDMKVNPGWIKYTRSVLGLTLKNLAKLSSLSIPGVADAERREEKGKITIENLTKLANAMECDFVYAFVPREDISDLLKKKATKKARKSILQADIHMSLEGQKVDEDLEKRVEALAKKILDKGKVW